MIGELVADRPATTPSTPTPRVRRDPVPGPDEVDLTGWGVRDETASHRYSFLWGSTRFGRFRDRPLGLRHAVGDRPLLVQRGSAIWNNDDTAFPLDPGGNIVDTRAY